MLLTMVAAQQRDCAHEIAVSFDGRLAEELRAGGIAAARARRRAVPPARYGLARAPRARSACWRAGRHDAVIGHAPWSCALAGAGGAPRRAGRCSCGRTTRRSPAPGPNARSRSMPPDRFICNSRHTAAAIARWLPRVPRDVVHPPVPARGRTSPPTSGDGCALSSARPTPRPSSCSPAGSKNGKATASCSRPRRQLRGDVAVWIAGGPQRPAESAYFEELSRLADRLPDHAGYGFSASAATCRA